MGADEAKDSEHWQGEKPGESHHSSLSMSARHSLPVKNPFSTTQCAADLSKVIVG
jgi:hypothetical protein